MLHIGLVTFLGDLIDNMLHHYANYFLRNVLYQESCLNADYVPTAIKKIGLTLQSLEEVKDSKDYKAIFDCYIADKEATKIRWTEYVNEIDNLTRLGLKQRFLASFCKLLNSAARGFTAEVGTHPSYTKHEVVIDLLAITPTLLLGEPFNWTAEEFLTLYKKTNDLAYLPNPTAEQHLLEEIILKVNILCRKEPTIIVIDEDNPASNTITNTTTTTATTTTPRTLLDTSTTKPPEPTRTLPDTSTTGRDSHEKSMATHANDNPPPNEVLPPNLPTGTPPRFQKAPTTHPQDITIDAMTHTGRDGTSAQSSLSKSDSTCRQKRRSQNKTTTTTTTTSPRHSSIHRQRSSLNHYMDAPRYIDDQSRPS